MKKHYAFAFVPVLAILLSPFFANRVTPYILGLPFFMFWIVSWAIGSSVFMWQIYRLDHTYKEES